MALFQHEDFIILGMLFAKYFPAYIYDFSNGAWGGGSWSGSGGSWIPNFIVKYGTGRGGIITQASDADGDDGRPGVSDNATGVADPSLAGGKGTLTSPGDGLHKGQFGFGGNAQESVNGWTSSAGGGSGWFGGGSSFLNAGGGGGSNYCYSLNDLGISGADAVGYNNEGKPLYNPPDWLKAGLWVGIDIETLQHYSANKALYVTNCRHTNEYERYKTELGNAFEDYIRLRRLADGNGLILISEPNKLISYDKNISTIQNIATIIEFTGKSVSWKPPEDGKYHFILWGAQGGTIMYTPEGAQGLEYQQYTGGFGGAIGGIFELTKTYKGLDENNNEIDIETELFMYVGQRGLVNMRLQRSWNGGGNADGGCTSGGGATDIRWKGSDGGTGWQTGLYERLIVAGGGGGIMGSGNGNELPQPPFGPGKNENVSGGGDSESGEIVIPPDGNLPYFLVNDKSLVYVTIKYFTQSDLPPNYDIGCTIYINGGNEGILYQSFEIDPVNELVELVYPLDQVYLPNTDTHWVTISAKINTNVMFIIPDNGITIRVETRANPNEPDSDLDENKRPVFIRRVEKFSLIDLNKVTLILPPQPINESLEEKFILVDMYNVELKAVQLLKLSIVEQLSLTDLNDVKMDSPQPPGDIILKKLEGINLVDKVKAIMKDVVKQQNDSVEQISINDITSVKMKKAQTIRVSIVEQLSSTDIINIKEEQS